MRQRQSWPMLLASLLLCTSPALAQVWAGLGELEVRVRADGGGDVAGATVTMRYQGVQPAAGPSPVETDGSGQATVRGLAEGVWLVEVSHPEFLTWVARVDLEIGRKVDELQVAQRSDGSGTGLLRVRFDKVRRGSPPSPSAETAPRVAQAPPPEPEIYTLEPEPEDRPVAEPEEPAEPVAAPAPAPEEEPAAPVEPEEAEEGIVPSEPSEPAPVTPPPPEPETAEIEPPRPAGPAEAPPEVEVEVEAEPTPAEPAPAETTPAEPEPAETIETPPVPAPPAEDVPAPVPPEESEVSESPRPPVEPEPAAAEPPAAPEAAPRPIARIRTASDGSCPDCRAGESALSVDATAAPGNGLATCPADAAGRVERAFRRLAESIGGEMASFHGPLVDRNLRDLASMAPPDVRSEVLADLGPLVSPASSCRLLAILLPNDTNLGGFRYEARDVQQVADCLPDRECPLAGARWGGNPGRIEAGNRVLVWALFGNASPDQERHGRLTVYLR